MHVVRCQKLENTLKNLKTYQKPQQENHDNVGMRYQTSYHFAKKTLLDPVTLGDAFRMTE